MNNAELQAMCAELQSWCGGALRGASQPTRDRVVLQIGDRSLLLVPRGPFARLHPLTLRVHNPPKPYSFQGALRARLFGPLTGVSKAVDDRVIDLWFGENRLHLRLTGRSGGLWLIEGDRVIAAYDGPATVLPDLLPSPQRVGPPRFTPQPGESFGAAAERWFGRAERAQKDVDRRSDLERALRRQLSRIERLAEGLRDDLDRASEAPRLRRQADALAACLHQFPRGAAVAHVEDLEDPEIRYAIPLDPVRPAVATMERLYAKARRLDRSADRVLENLDQTERRVAELRAAIAAVPEAPADALEAFARLIPRSGRGEAPAARRPWATWTGPGGERVWVGRNAAGNRKLTFQAAKGGDYWMHLRDRPGAHLVIPVEKDKSPSLDLLLSAAQIALATAGIPEGTAAEVQYTRARNVRAIPGEVGRVTVHEEKVLRVVRDPSALARWAREE